MTGLRSFLHAWRRQPLTFLLILTALAFGTGANTAVFSVVQAVLFRSLPGRDPERLVKLYTTTARRIDDRSPLSLPIFRDYSAQSSSFTGLALYRDEIPVDVALGDGGSQRLRASVVSVNFFPLLGIHAVLGHLFSPADEAGGSSPPIVVLGNRIWRDGLGSDPHVLGRRVLLNGRAFTVVGVAPPEFSGVDLGRGGDLWLPLFWHPHVAPTAKGQEGYRSSSFFSAVGRLRPGLSRDAAQAELNLIAARLGAGKVLTSGEEEGFQEPWPLLLTPAETVQPELRRMSLLLLGSVLVALVAASVDVAGLLLAKAERDQRQLATRIALGASRGRILLQVAGEALIFVTLGALAGLLVAEGVLGLLLRFSPAGIPLPIHTGQKVLDVRVLAFTGGVALLAAFIVGLAPAFAALRARPAAVLKGGGDVRRGPWRLPSQSLLMIAQVAVSVVLLVAAGLLSRTLLNLNAVDPGFDGRRVLCASVDPARQGYGKSAGQQVLTRLLERARGVPGVRAAALSTSSPLPPPRAMDLPLAAGPEDGHVWVGRGMVSPDYFRTLGVPVLEGRDFGAQDRPGSPPVAIVNRAFAKLFWPGEEALGRRLAKIGPQDVTVEVVGVVGDVRNRGLREEPGAVLFLPLAQFYQAYPWQPDSTTLLISTPGPPERLQPALAAMAREVDPHLPLFQVGSLDGQLASQHGVERFFAFLFFCQAALAVSLVGVGLHGLVAFVVTRRSRELAVRIALGARARDLLFLLGRQTLRPVAIGLLLGLPAAVLASRSLSSLLFGVHPGDATSLAGAMGLLLLIAAAAVSGPLARALVANVTEGLRME